MPLLVTSLLSQFPFKWASCRSPCQRQHALAYMFVMDRLAIGSYWGHGKTLACDDTGVVSAASGHVLQSADATPVLE